MEWNSVLILMLNFIVIKGKSINDSDTLLHDLLTNYQKYSIPKENQDATLNVSVGMWPKSISEVDEVKEKFSYLATLLVHWKDDVMTWNASNYGGMETVFISWKDVWTPPIALLNPSDEIKSFGQNWQMVRYVSNGNAYWIPGVLFETSCPVNAEKYPFDTQVCKTTLHITSFSRNEINLVVDEMAVEVSTYTGHNEWTLLKTEAHEPLELNSIDITFHLKRKPNFIIINIVLPITFLSLMNVLVFVLVPESGERVSFCITVLLAIAVFMTIVSDTSPKSSEPVPIISYKLMIDMILSSMATVVTIFNLGVYNKPETGRKPRWILRVYACLYRHKENHDKNKVHPDDMTVSDVIENPASEQVKTSSIDVLDPKVNADNPDGETIDPSVTWKDISQQIDRIALFIFTLASFISFETFLILTTT